MRRVAASWLQTEVMDASAGQLQARAASPSLLKLSTTLLAKAQQRLVQAIKGLALVRKLRPLPTPVQIASRLAEKERPVKTGPRGCRFSGVPAAMLN